jgi:hypothetical protein
MSMSDFLLFPFGLDIGNRKRVRTTDVVEGASSKRKQKGSRP